MVALSLLYHVKVCSLLENLKITEECYTTGNMLNFFYSKTKLLYSIMFAFFQHTMCTIFEAKPKIEKKTRFAFFSLFFWYTYFYRSFLLFTPGRFQEKFERGKSVESLFFTSLKPAFMCVLCKM